MEKIISILMSTYNGEKYLDKQLESVSSQIGLEQYEIRLLVRDDGSTDNTVPLLEKWSERYNIKIIRGKNVGARISFYELIKMADDSDYYAFCDQDDVWNSDKIRRALECIGANKNSLYFSNVELMDENENSIGKTLLDDSFCFSLKRVLMCNPANGCTMLWTQELHNRLKQVDYSTFTMHDEFVCTIACLMGNVVYDPIPTMKYRIHQNNVTQAKGFLKKLKLTKQIWFERGSYSIDKRASILLELTANKEFKIILNELSNYKKGFRRFVVLWHYKCEDLAIERSFRLRMLLGVL